MGKLIQKFTFGRNTLKRTPSDSAAAVIASIARAEDGLDLTALKRDDNGAYNIIRDLISFSGVLKRDGEACRVTELGEDFKRLYSKNGEDAWRWLITRSLWLYVVPNGTSAEVNGAAKDLGSSFNFFRTMLGLLWHMCTLPGSSRFLYYDELCSLLDDDAVWAHDSADLFARVIRNRQALTRDYEARRGLLGDLEDAYKVPRDNLNTVFNKAFQQTGLFEYAFSGNRMVGIAISATLDPVLQNRIRFILDNPVQWTSGEWSDFVQLRQPDLPQELSSPSITQLEAAVPLELGELLGKCISDFEKCGLRVPTGLIHRIAPSLLAKRFLILTGLSGSGKTKIAQTFAQWITPDSGWVEDADHSRGKKPNPYAAVVPVGADWTSNEHILGYPDNLNGGYFKQTALKLLLQASQPENKDIPHFLILDEMNLSHVERYFADMLSIIESESPICLHHDEENGQPKLRDGVPNEIKLPENFFVIGTVNVDETTYMFSPKVLDRANVIEFRVTDQDMAEFLKSPTAPSLDKIAGSGAPFGAAFVQATRRDYNAGLTDEECKQLNAELMLLFKLLAEHGAEFGFRTGKEIARFLHFHKKLSGDSLDFRGAMDAQIVQKLLPKLHGSRNKLTGLLWALAGLCAENYEWKTEPDDGKRDETFSKWMASVRLAVESGDEKFNPANIAEKLRAEGKEAYYRLSFEKLVRIWRNLESNGFASFAEA